MMNGWLTCLWGTGACAVLALVLYLWEERPWRRRLGSPPSWTAIYSRNGTPGGHSC